MRANVSIDQKREKDRAERRHTGRVARLQGKSVEHEVQEDDVARSAASVGLRGGGEATRVHKSGEDVVECWPDIYLITQPPRYNQRDTQHTNRKPRSAS